MDKRWLTVEQISKDLGISEDTIRQYIRQKKLIAYRFGREYRVKSEDYEKFLEKRRTTEDKE